MECQLSWMHQEKSDIHNYIIQKEKEVSFLKNQLNAIKENGNMKYHAHTSGLTYECTVNTKAFWIDQQISPLGSFSISIWFQLLFIMILSLISIQFALFFFSLQSQNFVKFHSSLKAWIDLTIKLKIRRYKKIEPDLPMILVKPICLWKIFWFAINFMIILYLVIHFEK
jgi:hypothetical protein